MPSYPLPLPDHVREDKGGTEATFILTTSTTPSASLPPSLSTPRHFPASPDPPGPCPFPLSSSTTDHHRRRPTFRPPPSPTIQEAQAGGSLSARSRRPS